MSGSLTNLLYKYNSLQTQLFNQQLTAPQLGGHNIFTGSNAFTEIPTTATATAGDNSSKVATTEYVDTAISVIPNLLSTDNTFTGTNEFTQIPTTDTAPQLDSSSKVATTSYVDTAISVIPDLLSTDNIFTGTNDFTEQVSFSVPPHSEPPVLGNDLATKGYVDSLVGQYSGGLNLFLNYSQPVTVGGQPYYSISKKVSAASQQSITVSTVVGDNLLISFISNELNITEIPAGLFDLFLYGAVSLDNQIVYYRFVLKKYSGGVITTIASSGNSKDVNASPSSNPEVYLMNTTISSPVPMLLTDRIIIEIYYDKTGGVSVDLTTYFENTYYSFVQSTLNAGTTLLTSNNNWTGNNHFALSPTAPTVTAGDASTKVASTEFVTTAISNIPVNYIDALGNASGPIHMANNSIDFLNTNGANNKINTTSQNIVGYDGEFVENKIFSFSGIPLNGGSAYSSRLISSAIYAEAGMITSFFDSQESATTELKAKIDGTTPTIGASISYGGPPVILPIKITSPFNMDNNSISNVSSVDSLTTLTIGENTSLGVHIGRDGQTTDLKGNIKINSSAGLLNQVLTSTGTTSIWQTPETSYIDALGNVSGPLYTDTSIEFSSMNGTTNRINPQINFIDGYSGDYIQSIIQSSAGIVGASNVSKYASKMVASSSSGGVYTSHIRPTDNFKTELSMSMSGEIPSIGASLSGFFGPSTPVDIKIKSNLDMDQNAITNTPSIDSSTALTLGGTTALGVNIGRIGQTSNLIGNSINLTSTNTNIGPLNTVAGFVDIGNPLSQNVLYGKTYVGVNQTPIGFNSTFGTMFSSAVNSAYMLFNSGTNWIWGGDSSITATGGNGTINGGNLAIQASNINLSGTVKASTITTPTTTGSLTIAGDQIAGGTVNIGSNTSRTTIGGAVKMPNLITNNYIFRRGNITQTINPGSDVTVLFPLLPITLTENTMGVSYLNGIFTNTNNYTIMCSISYSIAYLTFNGGIRNGRINCPPYAGTGYSQITSNSGTFTIINGSSVLPLIAGATFYISTFQNSGQTLTLDVNTTTVQVLIL